MARNHLPLNRFETVRVLVGPARVEALRVTVFGPAFPQRAVAPELWIGATRAERIVISRDQRRLLGYFSHLPEEGGAVRVLYGDSLEGTLGELFRRDQVPPLPTTCGGAE